MLHWIIWDREPGVHEASLRRYRSKLVYHITVYFFTLVTVTCNYSTLTQLTYHFASYNSCSNWRPPISMQAWHRRTRFCRTLTNIPGVFWISLVLLILISLLWIRNHGRLARWIMWRACDEGEAKGGLDNELWRRWSNGRVGQWAVT